MIDHAMGHGGPKRSVFVVDDHPIVRHALVQLINAQEDLCVAGEGNDVSQSLEKIRELRPDLCVIDLGLGQSSGLDLVRVLGVEHPEIGMLIISAFDETLYAERALRLGARGFVMKHEPPGIILDAIRRVSEGTVYVSGQVADGLLDRLGGGRNEGAEELPLNRLTDRELEVFRLLGSGRSVREIATTLSIRVKTVESHREHLKAKLGLRSSAELLRFAIHNSQDAPLLGRN
ncbi:MAG TPA: response regulator transcription factor [Tepidisphaeraceae bacterium]|jgi:DNA-binding NarL/FixJ family response regulator